ncbi:MSCRAMM family protein [Listeria kieliensis]
MIHKFSHRTFKGVLAILLVLSAVFSSIIGTGVQHVKAAANTTTVHIVSKNVTYLYGPSSGTAVRMIDRLRNAAGQAVFCINFNLPSPDGLTYNEAERLDNATTYLLNAYYKGNSNLTGDRAYDEYLIQAAIHNIKSPGSFSLTNSSGVLYVDKDGSHKTVNKIKALVAEAKAAGNPTTPAFDNQLTVSNANPTAKLNGNKFISAPITVTVKGSGTVTAKLTNATANSYIGDENGNPLKTIKNGSKVTIVVPTADLNGKSTSPKVTFTGDFKQAYQVAKRLTGQPGYQDIATYGLDEFQEKKTAAFTTNIAAATGSISGVKVTDSKKPLGGAKIEIRNSKDQLVKAVTTAEDGTWGATGLAFGEYYWVETGTVDGYVLNGEKHPFTIDYNSLKVNAGDFVNKLMKGSIEGVKVDKDTNKPLAGAEFTLTDNNGEKQVLTTKEDGLFHFALEGGKTYTLEETKVPEGYKGSFKQENITLKNDGQIFKVTAQNEIQKGKLQIIKVDKETGKKLAGAEFTFTSDQGEKQVAVTDENGFAEFHMKKLATYTIKETKNPKGYSGAYEKSGITLENDGQVIKLTAKNTKDKVTVVHHTNTVTKQGAQKEKLVQTGDDTNNPMTGIYLAGAGLLLILAAAGVAFAMKRRKNHQ